MSLIEKDATEIFSKKVFQKIASEKQDVDQRKVELNQLAKSVAQQFSSDVVSPNLVIGLARLIEFLGVAACGILAYVFYVVPIEPNTSQYVFVSILGAFITVATIQAIDGYQLDTMRKRFLQYTKAITGVGITIIILLLVAFLTKLGVEFSRGWFAIWSVTSIASVIAVRTVLTNYIRNLTQNGRLERRAIIVGGGKPAADLIHSLEAMRDTDIRVCGIFDDRTDDRSPAVVEGYPKLGTIPELVEFGRVARIDMLIVTLPLTAESRVLQFLKKLWVLPVDIRLSAHSTKLRFRPRSYTYVGSVPFLDILEKPIADWDGVSKRIFDLFFATLGLICLSPLMLATMIAIRWESKGPVIFRQKRFGFNNEVIEVLKFRSMFHEMSDPEAKTVVTKGDPRVTRVGRFIRKTSIDELPQLINVIKGQLSLVGPRPHAVNAHTDNKLWDEVVDGYFARHKVKPGVTGWAQINGWRGEVDSDDKIQQRTDCDLYYIENWSLMFDLQILFATPFKLMNTENAY